MPEQHRFTAQSHHEAHPSPVKPAIAEAYFKAVHELRTSKSTEMNLPYFVATADGPKHLQRTVTAQVFAELARRDPYMASPIAAPAPAPEPPKKRKKLFGLF